MVQLASALEVNSGLEVLLIADNPFGDEGGQQLTSALCRTNRTLQVLDLHETHMTKGVEREVSFGCQPVIDNVLPPAGGAGSPPVQLPQEAGLSLWGQRSSPQCRGRYGVPANTQTLIDLHTGIAKGEARQRQEQHFQLQATTPSSNLY